MSTYLPLNKKGRNFWGRCPFHNEKTASFSVNSEGQFFKCFGCSVSGDAIKFVQDIESIPFIDACRLLADKVGFVIPDLIDNDKGAENKAIRDKLYKLMGDAATHYYNNLYTSNGKNASDYILNRGLSAETIKTFGLGFSLGANQLIDYLIKKGYTIEDISACGLIDEKDGRHYDALYGRLIFPIMDNFNQCIAFGGRLLEKKDFAKYKNTKETQIFSKGKVLYGINLLKSLKQNTSLKSLIIVEGYMDVLGLYDKGIKNVLASMGTALTEAQARLIKRYVEKVYIAYDGDAAGQNATLRSLDILYKQGLSVKVVALPDNNDPDDYVKSNGADAFYKLLDNSPSLFQYKIERLANDYDMGTYEGRGQFAKKSIEELSIIDSEVEKQPYIDLIAKISAIDIEVLKNSVNDNQASISNIDKTIVPNTKSDNGYTTALENVLYSYAVKKDYVDYNEDLSTYITEPNYREIYDIIIDIYNNNADDLPRLIFSKLNVGQAIFSDIMNKGDDNIDKDNEGKIHNDYIKRIKLSALEKKAKELTSLYALEQDMEIKKSFIMELSQVMEKIKTLKQDRI